MNLSDNRGTINDPDGATVERRRVPRRRRAWLRELDEHAEARRQDFLDQLEGDRAPAWTDDAGTVDVRLVAALVGVAAVVVAVVWLLWPYLVGVAVAVLGWRVATRHTRRRRPKSSWSSLGRTAAAMYAAYNSRWLKGSFRAAIPARAGREHAPCGECGSDRHDTGTVPF